MELVEDIDAEDETPSPSSRNLLPFGTLVNLLESFLLMPKI